METIRETVIPHIEETSNQDWKGNSLASSFIAVRLVRARRYNEVPWFCSEGKDQICRFGGAVYVAEVWSQTGCFTMY
jgi:hypothetical protein